MKRLLKIPKLGGPALAAALFLLPAGPWAQDLPRLAAAAVPAAAPAPVEKDASAGVPLSIMATAQGVLGRLGIGVGYVGPGSYLDETGARRDGLHASLEISVEGAPEQSLQPDVREGQNLRVADYRIRIDKIVAPDGRPGSVLVTVWEPPKLPAKARKGWRRFFGL